MLRLPHNLALWQPQASVVQWSTTWGSTGASVVRPLFNRPCALLPATQSTFASPTWMMWSLQDVLGCFRDLQAAAAAVGLVVGESNWMLVPAAGRHAVPTPVCFQQRSASARTATSNSSTRPSATLPFAAFWLKAKGSPHPF